MVTAVLWMSLGKWKREKSCIVLQRVMKILWCILCFSFKGTCGSYHMVAFAFAAYAKWVRWDAKRNLLACMCVSDGNCWWLMTAGLQQAAWELLSAIHLSQLWVVLTSQYLVALLTFRACFFNAVTCHWEAVCIWKYSWCVLISSLECT
jgi:hypothetical protein